MEKLDYTTFTKGGTTFVLETEFISHMKRMELEVEALREHLQFALGHSNCYCKTCKRLSDLYWRPMPSSQVAADDTSAKHVAETPKRQHDSDDSSVFARNPEMTRKLLAEHSSDSCPRGVCDGKGWVDQGACIPCYERAHGPKQSSKDRP